MRDDLPHAVGLSGLPDTTSGGGETRPNPAGRNPYEIFLAIAGLIVRDNSSLDLFKDLAPLLQELTGCDFVIFSLHDPTQNCIIAHFWKAGKEAGILDAFPVDECVSGWVWQHQQPMIIPDLEHDARFPTCLPASVSTVSAPTRPCP